MDRNPLEQRQILQRQAAGDGDFKAHPGQAFDRADIRLAPRYAGGLGIAAAVINHLLNARFTPLLRLLPGPVAGQFDLDVAVELFRHVQRAFGGVDVRAADHGDPVSVGFKAHAGENFTGIGDFGVRQHDFVGIERLQVANGAYALSHAENGTDFNNVHFIGNQARRFIRGRHRLVIERNLQHR